MQRTRGSIPIRRRFSPSIVLALLALAVVVAGTVAIALISAGQATP